MAAKNTAKSPCSCVRLGTACGGDTWNLWSPGHDARAKGVLQVAHRAGEKVLVDGKPFTAKTAAQKLGLQVLPWLDAPQAKVAELVAA
jgi:hypothetical protein